MNQTREMYFVCSNHSCRKTYHVDNYNKDTRDVKCKCGGTIVGKNGEVTITGVKKAIKTIDPALLEDKTYETF